MNSAKSEFHPVSATPDWEQLDIELRCPRCGYSLKLLTQPRCPECGLTFAWDEIIAAARRDVRDSPLFEFRWRDRPWKGLVATALLCLRPARLWQVAKMTDHVRGRGLVFWILIVLMVGVVAAATEVYILGTGFNVLRGRPIRPYVDLPAVLSLLISTPHFWAGFLWRRLGFLSAALVALALFKTSLVKHGVRPLHGLRIAIYAWSTLEIFDAAVRVAGTVPLSLGVAYSLPGFQTAGEVIILLSYTKVLWWSSSFYFAFQRYLALRNALAGAVAVTVFVAIALVTVTSVMSLGDMGPGAGWLGNAPRHWIPFARNDLGGILSTF